MFLPRNNGADCRGSAGGHQSEQALRWRHVWPRAGDTREVTAVCQQGGDKPGFDGTVRAVRSEKADAETDFTPSHPAQECFRVRCGATVPGEYLSDGPWSDQHGYTEEDATGRVGDKRLHVDRPVIQLRARSTIRSGSNLSARHFVDRTVPLLPYRCMMFT